MGEQSKIAWTDHTFNPWIGCTKISAGCDHCYAERDFCLRRKVVGWGDHSPRHLTSDAYWRQPLRWADRAVASGRRPRVFCGSLCDWLDPKVGPDWRMRLFRLINATPALNWLLLTKRPERTHYCVPFRWKGRPGNLEGDGWPPYVWQGVTIERQDYMPRLAAMSECMPYTVAPWSKYPLRFISAEPLLGPLVFPSLDGIGWVIVGGESGPGARPFNDDWSRSIRDQCVAAGVPFFFKQRGGHGKDAHDIPAIDGRTWTQTPWGAGDGGDEMGENHVR